MAAVSDAISLISFATNDQNYGAVLAVFLLIAAVSIFFLYAQHSKHVHGRGPGLPPGPLGVPLLGCLPFLDPRLHRYFAGLARTYGPVLSLRLGTKLFVVVSSAAAAREVLKDNDLVLANHPAPATVRAFRDQHHGLLHSPYGPVWRALRKVCVRDLLSQANLEVVRPLRQCEVRRIVATIRKRVGMPVPLQEVTLLAMLNLMTNMLWGAATTAEDAGAVEYDAVTKELVEVVESIIGVLGAPNISDFIPALAPLDLQGLGRKMTRLRTQYEMLIDELLQDMATPAGTTTENSGSSEGAAASSKKRNFLQVLLEIVERGDPQTPINMDNARGLLLDLLGGSMHTTSSTVEWAMAELLLHPDAMAKVKEELDAAVGRHKAVEESDVCKLPYVDAVLKETLRLHPIVPLLVPHEPSSSCVVGGYTVPKGTTVFTNVWAIQRDPSLWEDPDEFKPERFLNGTLDGDGDGDSAGAAYAANGISYLPFGSGRRICVGMSFAETTMRYMLASLLHAFEWRLPDGVELDLDDKFELVLTKVKPLVIIPEARLEEAEMYQLY